MRRFLQPVAQALSYLAVLPLLPVVLAAHLCKMLNPPRRPPFDSVAAEKPAPRRLEDTAVADASSGYFVQPM